MKRKNLTSGEISIWTVIFLTVVVVGLFVFLLLPELLHMGHHRTNPRTRTLSNLKQISTATIIYQFDYDGLYPPASGMPAIRVEIQPYIKNIDQYKPIAGKSTTPQFNFNLAGVSELLPPYPGTKQRAINEVAIWSSYILDKEKPGVIIAFADSGTKFFEYDKIDKINSAFEGQFDRKGVKLWPADYLKSLDPLK